jgi:nucleotide-binding universal stress UspA family protein
MKILIAVDGSKHSTAAVRAATRVLSSEDRDFTVLYIVPELPATGHGHQKERLLVRGERVLAAARKQLAEEGISARAKIETGSPGRVLIRASRDHDVVVVAAQSHRTDSTAGLGPVASRVAEHANSHVLIARPIATEGALRILAPVDGSDASLRTLELLGSLVDLESSEITLVHVVETPWLHETFDDTGTGMEGASELEAISPEERRLEAELEREGQRILRQASARLPRTAALNTMIFDGLPAEEILGELDTGEYDLAVVSTTHSTDLKHKLLGNVSSQIAWNAPCSVLLVYGTD